MILYVKLTIHGDSAKKGQKSRFCDSRFTQPYFQSSRKFSDILQLHNPHHLRTAVRVQSSLRRAVSLSSSSLKFNFTFHEREREIRSKMHGLREKTSRFASSQGKRAEQDIISVHSVSKGIGTFCIDLSLNFSVLFHICVLSLISSFLMISLNLKKLLPLISNFSSFS